MDNHKSVDVAGGSKADCGNILLWSYNGGKNQQWEVKIDPNDGYATIKNVNSGKLLDVEGGSIRDGANVCQYHENGGDNQKWLIKTSNNGYTITSKVSPNFKVDLGGGSTADGSNILMWHTNGGANQDFYFFNMNPDVPASDASFKGGYYKINSKNAPKMVADINGASLDNGANSII